jgi:hypothetical protein
MMSGSSSANKARGHEPEANAEKQLNEAGCLHVIHSEGTIFVLIMACSQQTE